MEFLLHIYNPCAGSWSLLPGEQAEWEVDDDHLT